MVLASSTRLSPSLMNEHTSPDYSASSRQTDTSHTRVMPTSCNPTEVNHMPKPLRIPRRQPQTRGQETTQSPPAPPPFGGGISLGLIGFLAVVGFGVLL